MLPSVSSKSPSNLAIYMTQTCVHVYFELPVTQTVRYSNLTGSSPRRRPHTYRRNLSFELLNYCQAKRIQFQYLCNFYFTLCLIYFPINSLRLFVIVFFNFSCPFQLTTRTAIWHITIVCFKVALLNGKCVPDILLSVNISYVPDLAYVLSSLQEKNK